MCSVSGLKACFHESPWCVVVGGLWSVAVSGFWYVASSGFYSVCCYRRRFMSESVLFAVCGCRQFMACVCVEVVDFRRVCCCQRFYSVRGVIVGGFLSVCR